MVDIEKTEQSPEPETIEIDFEPKINIPDILSPYLLDPDNFDMDNIALLNEKRIRLARGTAVKVRRLKQEGKDSEAEQLAFQKRAEKRKRLEEKIVRARDAFDNTVTNLLSADQPVSQGVLTVAAINLLFAGGGIDDGMRRNAINEFYDQNPAIEEKVIPGYEKVRREIELLMPSKKS